MAMVSVDKSSMQADS